jgi:ATP-dependent RNA helicase DeaD
LLNNLVFGTGPWTSAETRGGEARGDQARRREARGSQERPEEARGGQGKPGEARERGGGGQKTKKIFSMKGKQRKIVSFLKEIQKKKFRGPEEARGGQGRSGPLVKQFRVDQAFG